MTIDFEWYTKHTLESKLTHSNCEQENQLKFFFE